MDFSLQIVLSTTVDLDRKLKDMCTFSLNVRDSSLEHFFFLVLMKVSSSKYSMMTLLLCFCVCSSHNKTTL